MKTRLLNTIGILALALASGAAHAQTLPNTFNYQAVITSEDGTPVSNHDITVEVSILQGTGCDKNTCPVIWQELHMPKTNDFGSFSIGIGDKDAINTTSGSLSKYSDINWLDTKNGAYFLQVRVDFGEASYLNGMTDLGTTQFSAVPYSLAAESAKTAQTAEKIAPEAFKEIEIGTLKDVTISNAKANQILVYDGSSWKNTDPAEGLTNIDITDPKTGDQLIYDATSGKWQNKTPKALTLSDCADVKFSSIISGNDFLSYNGTGKWENKKLTLNLINGVSVPNPKKGQVLSFTENGLWEAADVATGGGATKLAELTDVNITSPSNGQILKYTDGKWSNADASADNIWMASSSPKYVYTSYKKIGIGTAAETTPSAFLHIQDGNNNTLFNARGITIGSSVIRTKATGTIALGSGTENDIQGSAVIAGNGSSADGFSQNSIVMGAGASSGANCTIVVGDNSSAGNEYSAVFGNNLKTNYTNQYIFGQYNYPSSASTFIVANGTGSGAQGKNIFTIDRDGNVTAKEFNPSSDIRLKTNINTMTGALDNVLKLRGVTFNWKESSDNRLHYGFIAQEIEKVFPDLVGTDSNGFKTVNYSGVIPVLTEAIKTQQEEIESLKSENEQLKSTLEQLLKRVEALENR